MTTINYANLAAGHSAGGVATSTAAVITVNLGFKPKFVQCVNIADRITIEHYGGMDAGKGVKTIAAGTRTYEAANCITINANGFTIGTDAHLNPAGSKAIYFMAIG